MKSRFLLAVVALVAALASFGVSHGEATAIRQTPASPPATPLPPFPSGIIPSPTPTGASTGATPGISPLPTASEIRLRG